MTKDHVKLENSKKSNVQFFFEMVPQLKRVKKWSLKNISDKYFETKQFGTKMMIISKYGSDMPQKLHIPFQLHFYIHLTPFGGLKTMFLYALFQGGEFKINARIEILELALHELNGILRWSDTGSRIIESTLFFITHQNIHCELILSKNVILILSVC